MMVFLCGLPNVGKTTCGQIAAEKLGWHFIDLDRKLEAMYFNAAGKKQSCREIYTEEGAQSFRQWEQRTLFGIEEMKNAIVSLGGGTLESEDNQHWILQKGALIYLKCSAKIVFERIGNDLPSFLNSERPYESFIELAEHRQSIYENLCHSMIDVESLAIDDVVSLIVENIERSLNHGNK